MRRPHTHTHRRTAPALVALALLLACGLLDACGGSDGSSGATGAARERSHEQKAETEFQAYARCMREHGVKAEAITRPGGGHGLKVGLGNGGPAAAEAAEKACARYRPKEPSKGAEPPQVKAEHEEALQKFAKCMREHGIKVETSAAGGVDIQIKPGGGGPKPESPAFEAAQRLCQKLLPGGGPLG